MEAKTFEIRDKATFIPILAVKLNPVTDMDRYLLARAGYGVTVEQQSEYVQLCRIAGGEGKSDCDPYGWGNRTMTTAHDFIIKNWEALASGCVIDVEYILGERDKPQISSLGGRG